MYNVNREERTANSVHRKPYNVTSRKVLSHPADFAHISPSLPLFLSHSFHTHTETAIHVTLAQTNSLIAKHMPPTPNSFPRGSFI